MFVFDMIRAEENIAIAENITVMARNHLNNPEIERQKQRLKLVNSMEKLANRKKVIVSTTIKRFIEVYEKLMTVDFDESDTIYPWNQNELEDDLICELRSMVVTSGYAMDVNQTIYTYLVGTLEGRSFLDDDLNLIHKKSEHDVDGVKSRNRKAAVITDVYFLRSERMSVLLAHLNLHFRMRLEKTAEMVDTNGRDRSSYSIEEKQIIRKCLELAAAVKLIIDTPLIDEAGALTERSLEAIRWGNACLG